MYGEKASNSNEIETPLKVKIFWVIILAPLYLYFIHRMENGKDIANAVIQLAAVAVGIFAAGAAIAASKIAKENLEEIRLSREEVLRGKKPYFTFMSGLIGTGFHPEEGEYTYLHSNFKNVGVHPAQNITAKVVFIFEEETTNSISLETNFVNDIPSQFELEFNRGDVNTNYLYWRCYVVFQLKYSDAITQDYFNQNFYYQFSDYDNRNPAKLYTISREVKGEIDSYLRSLKD